jgi:hypothetical protein
MVSIDPVLLGTLKRHVGLLVGQHAATVIPSLDATLAPVHHRLGFEPRVLDRVSSVARRTVVTFVGSLIRGVHESRIRLLEGVAARLGDAFELWGPSIERLDPASPLRERYRGPAWGVAMYEVLSASAITLNEHGDIPAYANNCRLYEATGVGTLLVTDWKPDLGDLFELGGEVVAFRDAGDCIDLLEHYVDRPAERDEIAAAGQRRTLQDHTYRRRMEELVDIVEPFLSRQRVA